MELLNTVKQYKYKLLQLFIQGKIVGKRSVDKRRYSWLKNMREWLGSSTTSLFRVATLKSEYHDVVQPPVGE